MFVGSACVRMCLPLPVVHTYLLMCCSACYIWHVRGRRTFPLSGIHRIRDAYLVSLSKGVRFCIELSKPIRAMIP